MCKPLRTQNFRAPRISWYSFGDICRPFQPSHVKNHKFHFFTKLPIKPSSYAVVHRQPWACANPSELKTFVHQEFHGIHLGTYVGLSIPHISKTMNFIFSQNSPPRNLDMPWCTDNLAMCKPLRTQTFVHQKFHGIHLGTFVGLSNPHISKTMNFIFSQNSPPRNLDMPWCTDNLAMCKPLRTQTFVHQKFHGIHLGTFVGLSNPHISKTTNFIFSQNSPPSNQVMP